MSAVFSLNSDDQFITASNGDSIEALRYKRDMNEFKTIRQSDYTSGDHWLPLDYVGPGQQYAALEVFGTTIEGDQLKQLLEKLKAVEDDEKIHFFVNRLGLCIISYIKHPTINAMRIHDYFGWSKYGVKLPRDITTFTAWSKVDMFTGEALIDGAPGGMGRPTGEANDRELAACKKELEEKTMELAACKEELEWSKKFELRLSKYLVEEKGKVDELMTKNKLRLAFKADDDH